MLDAPAPFTENPSDQQTTTLVQLLIPERQDFSFLVAERNDEVEWFVRQGQLDLPQGRATNGRRLRRALRDLTVDAGAVSKVVEVSRYWLARGTGPYDAEVALTRLSTSHLWTDTWLLRLHEWREEQSMLVAGPTGTHERLAAAGLSSWAVGSTEP